MTESRVKSAVSEPPGTFKVFDFRVASWWAGPWWLLLMKGILAISLGILAWVWPAPTLFVILVMFGAFALTDGITTIATSVSHRKSMKGWGWSLTGGIFGTIIGILMFVWPFMSWMILLLFIAAWIMVVGVFNIASVIAYRKEMKQWGWSLAAGIVAVVFSIVMFVTPAAGALALLWVWATFGIVYGTLMCIQAYRTKRAIKNRA